MILKKANTMPDLLPISQAVAVDGDTIRCMVSLPLGIQIEQRLRLKGFYAPELNGRTPDLGIAAKEKLQAFLKANTLAIRTLGMERDRYGRLVCDIGWPDRLVRPEEVLGPLQLSYTAHTADVVAARKAAKKSGFIRDEIAVVF